MAPRVLGPTEIAVLITDVGFLPPAGRPGPERRAARQEIISRERP
jgi:hypothetical protein